MIKDDQEGIIGYHIVSGLYSSLYGFYKPEQTTYY